MMEELVEIGEVLSLDVINWVQILLLLIQTVRIGGCTPCLIMEGLGLVSMIAQGKEAFKPPMDLLTTTLNGKEESPIMVLGGHGMTKIVHVSMTEKDGMMRSVEIIMNIFAKNTLIVLLANTVAEVRVIIAQKEHTVPHGLELALVPAQVVQLEHTVLRQV
jgi:hypothetical protein